MKIVRLMQSSPQDVHVDVPMGESKKKRKVIKEGSNDEPIYKQIMKHKMMHAMSYEEMMGDMNFLENLGKEMQNQKFAAGNADYKFLNPSGSVNMKGLGKELFARGARIPAMGKLGRKFIR